jgi:hypothetical protein
MEAVLGNGRPAINPKRGRPQNAQSRGSAATEPRLSQMCRQQVDEIMQKSMIRRTVSSLPAARPTASAQAEACEGDPDALTAETLQVL